MTTDTPPPMGHNGPPDPAAERAAEIIAAANRWATERPELTDQDMADKCSAFLDQITAATKSVEAAKKTEKQPHMDAARAVDEKWKPWAEKLAVADRLLRPKLTAWLAKLRMQQDEAARLAREEARRKADEAARAAAEAEKVQAGGDVIGATVKADEAARAAAEAEKVAAKAATAPVNIKSSLGARTKSLRTNWRADVTDLPKAVWHYRHHPKMAALVQELANADARAMAREQGGKSTIPGVAFVAKQVAA